MSFAWPKLLWLLLVPTLWLVAELSRRAARGSVRHPKILQAQAGNSVLSFTASAPTRKSHSRWWMMLSLAFAVVALARPQWGHLEEPVFDQSREILLAMDLSRSMLTPDIKPSRLERAKLLVQSLLEKLAGERVGMVVFSGTAFLQSPLSSDYEILREFLPTMGPDYLPEGGTNYRALLETSLQAFGNSSSADRFLIIFSDGEATDDDWKPLVPELKKHGIRVLGLGVGTSTGAIIPDGSGGFVKDDRGAVVLSKLEPGTLQELATATNGLYRDASSWIDLSSLVQQTVDAGQKGKFVEKNNVRLVERFQWPLAFSLAALLLSLCYDFPVRPRPRELKVKTDVNSASPSLPAAVATAALLGFILALPPRARSAEAVPPATPAPSAALSKMVGRLAVTGQRSAQDWAELAQETINWGQHLQSDQHPVPAGPVQDALLAVDRGASANAKQANWPELRDNLKKLLEDPDNKKNQDKPPPDQSKSDEQKKDDQKSEDQKKSDSKPSQDKNSGDQNKSEKSPPKDGDRDQSQNSDTQNQPTPSPNPSDQKKESAFGDMKQNAPSPTPAPPGEMQKVGGVPDKPPGEATPGDPALAVPTQKLEQVRNNDSPARLFQLMEGQRKPKPKTGKDW